jgi:hypothetical protein
MLSVWAAAAARATGQCRLISCVVRHIDTCCGLPQKARTSPALCIAGSTAVAGLGWLAGWTGSAATFAVHFSSLCRLGSMQTTHSPHRVDRPLNIRREAALPPARRRRSPPKECSGPRVEVYIWPTGGVKSGQSTDRNIRGAAPHHFGTLPDFPHRFCTHSFDFAGLCPQLWKDGLVAPTRRRHDGGLNFRAPGFRFLSLQQPLWPESRHTAPTSVSAGVCFSIAAFR